MERLTSSDIKVIQSNSSPSGAQGSVATAINNAEEEKEAIRKKYCNHNCTGKQRCNICVFYLKLLKIDRKHLLGLGVKQ